MEVEREMFALIEILLHAIVTFVLSLLFENGYLCSELLKDDFFSAQAVHLSYKACRNYLQDSHKTNN